MDRIPDVPVARRPVLLQARAVPAGAGVPMFINDEGAVLVAITAGPSGNGALTTITINRVVDLPDSFNDLNEFKQTRIAR